MGYGGTRGGAGGILVRFETLDGVAKWRNVPDLEHRTLCRAAGLPEEVTWFDVPASFAGGSGREGRKIEGLIHQGKRDTPPIGRITLVEQGEKFDEDYLDMVRRLGWRAA